MFQKILIANRGEIACRVMATAARMGIGTVAVYSDADARAKQVAMAGEAVRIGPAAVADSYLRGERIIEAALRTGAEAVHPGYGFLSENAGFVEAVEAAGLVFIGPPASAIRAMGLKDAAKTLMAKAGVPVVPGYHGENQDPDFLSGEAEKIGYPVLIKARAGGGGKGMRLVQNPGDFRDALAGAGREGQASFGDPACLVEKYVTHPRHIEIQVFGDSHGNVVHLFERDCSLQRRHQKVIEEAPAPGMTPAVREAMGRAAVEAASAIGYSGAGTVEFIVDGSGPLREHGFWFMEMNTRLQVEHPVSEAITGLDFVEMQLRIAAGEPLPVRQEDLSIDGWAFEARIYAEDVPKGFLPATGRLEHLHFPAAMEFGRGAIRIDSGVRQGDEIGPWYDPMIAKLIVHGPSRAEALNRLSGALQGSRIVGSETNLDFLAALSRHEGFRRGEVDTGLISRDLPALLHRPEPPPEILALAAMAGLGLLGRKEGQDPWDSLIGWRHWSDARDFVHLDFDGERIEAEVTCHGRERFTVAVAGRSVALAVMTTGETGVRVEVDDRQFRAEIIRQAHRVSVFAEGRSFSFGLPDALSDGDEEQAGGDTIAAPMPGMVRAVYGKAGAAVRKGEALLVLEAMKMEHTLVAPRDGIVAIVSASEGEQVAGGALLLALEPQDG